MFPLCPLMLQRGAIRYFGPRSRGRYVSDGSSLAPSDTFDCIEDPGPVDGYRLAQKTRHMMNRDDPYL